MVLSSLSTEIIFENVKELSYYMVEAILIDLMNLENGSQKSWKWVYRLRSSVEAGLYGLCHLLGGHGSAITGPVIQVADHPEPEVDGAFLLEELPPEVLLPVFDALELVGEHFLAQVVMLLFEFSAFGGQDQLDL